MMSLDEIKKYFDKKFNDLETKLLAEVGEIKAGFVEIERLREVVSKQEHRIDLLENKLRKNNLVIFGTEEKNSDELLTSFCGTVNDLLNIELRENHIDDIYKLKNRDGTSRVVVRLVSYLKKLEILKHCKKLKNTAIYISNDLSLKQREDRKQLIKYRGIARKNNKEAFIKNGKLIVDGRSYTLDELADEERKYNNSVSHLELEVASNTSVEASINDTISDVQELLKGEGVPCKPSIEDNNLLVGPSTATRSRSRVELDRYQQESIFQGRKVPNASINTRGKGRKN